MWLAILFSLIVAYLIYYFCFKPYNYWKNRGIIYEIPLPLLGNFGDTILRKKHVSEINAYLYRKYANERYVGMYIFMKPALLLRDVDLIKKICFEEFDHFSDRVKLFDKECDTVIGNILVNRTGKEWKEMRSTLNTAFTDVTMKHFFDFISVCSETLTNYFVKENRSLLEIKLNETLSKYNSDVISSTCFGVECNSLEDANNEFFKMNTSLTSFGALQKLKLSLIQLCPIISKILHIKVYPSSKTDYLKNVFLENMRKREIENINRFDFIHYLMKVMKGISFEKENNIDRDDVNLGFAATDVLGTKSSEETEESQKKEWTKEEMSTQALMFTNSHVGLEPIMAASSFMAYELALNPDVQVKLQEEIDNVLQNSDNKKVTYEAVVKMKYMDCVVLESLRKWPPVYQIDRLCVKNFYEVDLTIPDDEKIVIEEGTAVIIPVMAIHRDPQYYPDPDRFNPDRFNSENRHTIIAGSYIPFGQGPRSCIGSKFALLEIKLLFFHLLSKFDLAPTAKTTTPFDLTKFNVKPVGHTFLGLKPRKVTSL